MRHRTPSDIQRILEAMSLHHMEVAGPTVLADKVVYYINGHKLTEDEIRSLSQKQLLTSWDILNYARARRAKQM
jgi:hypothetical protein